MRKCRAQRESKWLNGSLNTEYLREYPPKSVPLDRRRPGALRPCIPGMRYARKSAAVSILHYCIQYPWMHPIDDLHRCQQIDKMLTSMIRPCQTLYGMYTCVCVCGHCAGNPLLDSAPFYGQTTNRADYTPKQGRAQSARRAEGPLASLPFDGRTTYNGEGVVLGLVWKRRGVAQSLDGPPVPAHLTPVMS